VISVVLAAVVLFFLIENRPQSKPVVSATPAAANADTANPPAPLHKATAKVAKSAKQVRPAATPARAPAARTAVAPAAVTPAAAAPAPPATSTPATMAPASTPVPATVAPPTLAGALPRTD
jgi:hypothetical protein